MRWTQRAVTDLVAIGDHIAIDDPVTARSWVDRLMQRALRAEDVPRAGRVIPEIGREVFLRTYRLVYRVVDDRIVMFTVFEGHRMFGDVDPDDDE